MSATFIQYLSHFLYTFEQGILLFATTWLLKIVYIKLEQKGKWWWILINFSPRYNFIRQGRCNVPQLYYRRRTTFSEHVIILACGIKTLDLESIAYSPFHQKWFGLLCETVFCFALLLATQIKFSLSAIFVKKKIPHLICWGPLLIPTFSNFRYIYDFFAKTIICLTVANLSLEQ